MERQDGPETADSNICGFPYPWGSWNSTPMDNEGVLCVISKEHGVGGDILYAFIICVIARLNNVNCISSVSSLFINNTSLVVLPLAGCDLVVLGRSKAPLSVALHQRPQSLPDHAGPMAHSIGFHGPQNAPWK